MASTRARPNPLAAAAAIALTSVGLAASVALAPVAGATPNCVATGPTTTAGPTTTICERPGGSTSITTSPPANNSFPGYYYYGIPFNLGFIFGGK